VILRGLPAATQTFSPSPSRVASSKGPLPARSVASQAPNPDTFAFLIASSRAGCGAERSVGARGRAATGTRAPRAWCVLQRRAACAAQLPTLGPAAHCSTAAALSRDTASPSFRETESRRAMQA